MDVLEKKVVYFDTHFPGFLQKRSSKQLFSFLYSAIFVNSVKQLSYEMEIIDLRSATGVASVFHFYFFLASLIQHLYTMMVIYFHPFHLNQKYLVSNFISFPFTSLWWLEFFIEALIRSSRVYLKQLLELLAVELVDYPHM